VKAIIVVTEDDHAADVADLAALLPAIAARHWATEVSGMVYAASVIALASSVIGLLLSYHADLPSGPAIVLMAGAAWAASVLFGPVDGLAQRFIRRRHLSG
jgi:zinc/manganese transport system permease protein